MKLSMCYAIMIVLHESDISFSVFCNHEKDDYNIYNDTICKLYIGKTNPSKQSYLPL